MKKTYIVWEYNFTYKYWAPACEFKSIESAQKFIQCAQYCAPELVYEIR